MQLDSVQATKPPNRAIKQRLAQDLWEYFGTAQPFTSSGTYYTGQWYCTVYKHLTTLFVKPEDILHI